MEHQYVNAGIDCHNKTHQMTNSGKEILAAGSLNPNKRQGQATSTMSGKYYCATSYCEEEKVYELAGSCPVCGMILEKVF